MCYAIPGKVIEINASKVIVDYFGERRSAKNELLNLKIGDYIFAQGGFVINRIPEEEAVSILEAWKEVFFDLKKIDLRLSRIETENIDLEEGFLKILDKADEGKKLETPELLRLLKTDNEKELNLLFKTANFLRQKYLKNSCCVHGIIEFSNICRNNCHYCGLRRDNWSLKRYRMTIEEIVEASEIAVGKLGFKALVLQGGEDPYFTGERLAEIVKRIKEQCSVLLFMSIGDVPLKTYQKLYEAGARGVLLRFETSNLTLYNRLRPGVLKEGRVELLKYLYELGYLIITGSLIGLPNQRDEDILSDIALISSLNANMYSIGPFIPHPETPLSGVNAPDINLILKVIAISRLVNPNAKIVVTTALETLDKINGRKLGLLAGANSLMINVTPQKYRELYSIYPNRAGIEGSIKENIKETLDLLYSLGRAPTDLGSL